MSVEQSESGNRQLQSVRSGKAMKVVWTAISSVMQSIFLAGFLALALPLMAQVPPAGGPEVPELSLFDGLMQDYMVEHGISAGMLAIGRNGRILFDRRYGWRDAARSERLPSPIRMRIASVTKPFTAVAIRRLIANGALELATPVFDIDGNGGVLPLEPFGAPDPRLGDITIQHCLLHRGGWDRNVVGDHTYREIEIAAALGIPNPPDREQTMRWIMGQPLQFTPGAGSAYSNIGYLALGLVVEHLASVDLETYLEAEALPSTGIDPDDIRMGRTFAIDQGTDEPYYHEPSLPLVSNVYFPAFHPDPLVPAPYGGWNHEARTGSGRLVASADALVRFAGHYQVNGTSIGGPRLTLGTLNFSHTGSLPGTNALIHQRGDGIDVAIVFNERRPVSPNHVDVLRVGIDHAFDNDLVDRWPPSDRIFASQLDRP